ncbi:MAG: peptidoglycan-binding domain-containing protein [Candidatus Competibacteraceae bacterium]|nr:peptidoglycan-binding domain-containing protein [Candidatus Competibacteraceae bacterium]
MATMNKVLRKGSKGQEVKLLQSLLNQKVPVPKLPQGRKLVEDGDFGNNTDAAVRTFQQQNRLTVDGIVGGKTWAALGVQFVGAPVSPGTGGSTLVQLPQSGSGYYSYAQSHGRQWYGEDYVTTIQKSPGLLPVICQI